MPPLANGTAVYKGMSLAISCCQCPNRSAVSLTTLILLVLTAQRMQPTRQNTVIHLRWSKEGEVERGGRRGKGRGGKGREKGIGGRGRWAASQKGGGKGIKGRGGEGMGKRKGREGTEPCWKQRKKSNRSQQNCVNELKWLGTGFAALYIALSYHRMQFILMQ